MGYTLQGKYFAPCNMGYRKAWHTPPCCFKINMRPLGEVIELRCHHYADTTQLYLRLPSDPKVAMEELGQG